MREVQKLPEVLAREVLGFIGFIELKHGLKDRLAEDLKPAQELAMRYVWDKPEDEIWNDV